MSLVTLTLAATFPASGCVSPGWRTEATAHPSSKTRSCNAAAQVERFMTTSKPPLTRPERNLGFISTPLKYVSTWIDGPNAWQVTGCDASGSGHPVREAQHSTDGFYTVDVAIADAEVEGTRVPPGRYVRLEVMPGTAAHHSIRHRLPGPADLISFQGPLVWDKDVDHDHPCGHMEVHPFPAIEFLPVSSR